MRSLIHSQSDVAGRNTFYYRLIKLTTMPANFLSDFPELTSPTVHIKDPNRVNRLLADIMQGGLARLQIIADFDRTITKQHENGKKHLSSFGMFTHCPSVTQEYLNSEARLTAKYYPLEIDPAIPASEKRKLMEEWWAMSEEILKGLRVSQNEIDKTAAALGPSLRDGTDELFRELNKAEVPVLVFSAGLGNAVVAVLKYFNVLFPNVKVISNFLEYDDAGVIQGFNGPLIHVLNKNECALKGTEYYEAVQDRDNVILMGDSLGDASMAEGMAHTNAVLKIGFLYDHITESLPDFVETFDIVLVDDQTMKVVRAILKPLF